MMSWIRCRALRVTAVLTAACWIIPIAAHAHGDDHVLIEALTAELAKAPEADLFIRRGELFRHLQQWAQAEADYIAAGRLEPKLALVDFFRARVLLDSGAAAKAQPFAERYVAEVPDEAEGWFLRGEIRHALGQPAAGAADYTAGIQRTPRALPEHFLRRAKMLAEVPDREVQQVIAALDEGITRLGPIIALVDYAIVLELARKNFDGALARVEVAMAHAPRREAWLVRQGDILVQGGRTGEAVAAYRAALEAIDQLPPRYRETVPVEKLARDAQASLGRLSSH